MIFTCLKNTYTQLSSQQVAPNVCQVPNSARLYLTMQLMTHIWWGGTPPPSEGEQVQSETNNPPTYLYMYGHMCSLCSHIHQHKYWLSFNNVLRRVLFTLLVPSNASITQVGVEMHLSKHIFDEVIQACSIYVCFCRFSVQVHNTNRLLSKQHTMCTTWHTKCNNLASYT